VQRADETVGFLVVSLLDKSHLQQAFSRSSWGDDASAGRARVVLFLGVALMAGGLAGSLVSTFVVVCAVCLAERAEWVSLRGS
jgi:hypothetical protein